MPFKPIGARLVIKRIDPPDKGTIIIPPSVQKRETRPVFAEVVEVGSGAYLETGQKVPVSVERGDTVLVPSNTGYQILENGKEYWVINERDVIAIYQS